MRKLLTIIAIAAAACMTTQAAETVTVQAIVPITFETVEERDAFLASQQIGDASDEPDVRLSAWAFKVLSQALKDQVATYNAKLSDAAVEAFKATLTNSAQAIVVGEE